MEPLKPGGRIKSHRFLIRKKIVSDDMKDILYNYTIYMQGIR